MAAIMILRDLHFYFVAFDFRAVQFGDDALRFVSKPDLRPRNLRGIFMRVVQGGEVGPGDPVEVLGFEGVCEAAEHVEVVENDRRAR